MMTFARSLESKIVPVREVAHYRLKAPRFRVF